MSRPDPLDVDPSWQHRLRVERYHQMIDAGVLGEDDRVELIEGVLVQMSPQEPPHAWIIEYLTRLLVRDLGDDYAVRPQLPLTLARSEPEPDLAVTDARRRWPRHPQTGHLVVEVAGESLRKDRTLKAAIYAEAAIPEYWIIDVDHHRVHVLTDPDPAQRRYRTERVLAPGATLRATSLPSLTLSIDDLFPVLADS
jgi:Uma2 family endonuclease